MAGDYGASLAIACGAAGGKVKPVLPWPDLRDAHVIVAYNAGVRPVAAMHAQRVSSTRLVRASSPPGPAKRARLSKGWQPVGFFSIGFAELKGGAERLRAGATARS